MAINDAALKLTRSAVMDLQTFTTNAVGLAADYVDLLDNEALGGSEPLRLLIHVRETPVADTGSPIYYLGVVVSNVATFDNATTAWLCSSGPWGHGTHLNGAQPTIGSTYELVLSPLVATVGATGVVGPIGAPVFARRYLTVAYHNIVAATDFAAGQFDFYLTKDVAHAGKIYPAALANLT